MAVCAVQGDAGLELVPLPAGGACAGVTLVEQADIPPNPFVLSPEHGAIYSSAIAAVWIAAWSFRRFIDVLRGPEDKS